VERVAFEAVPVSSAAAVVLRGEFDMADVAAFHEAFDAVRSTEPDRLYVDLSELTFIGSSGLGALVEATRRHPRVILRGASRAVTRVVELTGLQDQFEFEDLASARDARSPAAGD
jgi:anti-sigma B factor antagonist